MDIVQHSIAFREGDVLRSHLLYSLGRSAPNKFKGSAGTSHLLYLAKMGEHQKVSPSLSISPKMGELRSVSRTLLCLTFCKTPCNQSRKLTLKASEPQPEREFRERKKLRTKETEHAPAVQLRVTTEHRFLRHMVQGRASCPADHARLKSRHGTATCRHPTCAFAHLPSPPRNRQLRAAPHWHL